MADVFISYSRRDAAFVRELHAYLTGAGRDVWVDWEDIPPASQWEEDIDESIDAAESFVFVVSDHSLASEYCLLELRHAEKRGKRIVPLACDGADPAAAPEELRQLNWIWCREADDRDAALAQLMSALDTDLAWAKAHTWLLVRAVKWDARRDSSLLLRGRDLEEASQQLAQNAGKEPAPTELQHRYIDESRRAASRRQRTLLGGVSLALVVSIALGVLALLQRNDARRATRKATSVALASTAKLRVATKPDQALLLALAAYGLSPSGQARDAAFTALEAARKLGVSEFLHGDSEVRSIAFAPGGRTLAVGTADGGVKLWDVRAHRVVAELAAPGRRPVVSVDFVRGGSTLAVGSADGTVRLWDVRSRRVGRTFRAPRAILAAAVSADARTAAAVGGRHVWLWEVRSGKERRLRAPKGDVALLAFSPDGRTLAAAATVNDDVEAGTSSTLRVIDVAAGRFADAETDDSFTGLAFAPDGHTLAVAGYTNPLASKYGQDADTRGLVMLWDVRRRRTVGRLESRSFVDSVAVARGGRTIVAGFQDGTIRRGVPAKGTWVGAPLHVLPGGVTLLALGRDGHTVGVAAQGDTAVRVWDLNHPATLGRPIAHEQPFGGVAFGRDGRTVAAAAGYDGVLLVRPGTREPTLLKVPHSDASVDEVAFSGDGTMLAASSGDGSILVRDLRRNKWAYRLSPDGDAPGSQRLVLDRTGRLLAALDFDGTLRLWDVPRERLRERQPRAGDVVSATFADGDRTLVTAGAGGFERWDVASGERRGGRRPLAGISAAALSADGRTAAFADADGRIMRWDLRSRADATEVARGFGRDGTLALSADGRTLAVTGADGDAELWDVRERVPLGQPLPDTRYSRFAFSPDGRTLVSAGGGPTRLWEGILWRDLADLRAQVCRLVVGDLTDAEWTAIAPSLPQRITCKG